MDNYSIGFENSSLSADSNITGSGFGSGGFPGGFPGGFNFMIPDPWSPVEMLQRVVAIIGFTGNMIAMIVVLKGRSIRKNASYIFLFNQSLSDFLSCWYVLIWPLVQYITGAGESGKSGWGDYIVCVVVDSRAAMTLNTVISTYNLVLLAGERTLSIVFPVHHRMYATDRRQFMAAALVWPLTLILVTPFVVANNGINEFGKCRYNDRMKASPWFYTLFESLALYIPLCLIIAAYISIIVKLRMGHAAVKKRLANVLRTLVTVVVVYVLCSTLRNVLAMMGAYNISLGKNRVSLYSVAYSLRIVSFCVNPLIYTLQYADYRNELKKMMCCDKGGSKVDCSEDSSTDGSKRLDGF